MTVKVKKSDPPESTEILAAAIVHISEGMEKLTASGLNEDAIVTLIQHKTKLSRRNIEVVLDAQKRLAGWYCR